MLPANLSLQQRLIKHEKWIKWNLLVHAQHRLYRRYVYQDTNKWYNELCRIGVCIVCPVLLINIWCHVSWFRVHCSLHPMKYRPNDYLRCTMSMSMCLWERVCSKQLHSQPFVIRMLIGGMRLLWIMSLQFPSFIYGTGRFDRRWVGT